jgi:hypothetical protein
MLEPDDVLIRIVPTQIDRHHIDIFRKERLMVRRWVPHFGRYFKKGLTPEELKKALTASNVKPDKYSIEQHSDLILYKYEGKPPIVLNMVDSYFYGIKRYIEKHGLDATQYQAYIIIEILRKCGFSSARRGGAKFPRLTQEESLRERKVEPNRTVDTLELRK